MEKTVLVNDREIVLPGDFTWILFRHGTASSVDKIGLTDFGCEQVWSTSWKILEKFTQIPDKTTIIHSPVSSDKLSTELLLRAIRKNCFAPDDEHLLSMIEFTELGQKPCNEDKNCFAVIKILISLTYSNEVVIAVGHDGFFEKIAQIVHPKEGGYAINPGEAFIVTPAGIEVIRPQISGLTRIKFKRHPSGTF